MRIIKLKNLSKQKYQQILTRSFGTNPEIMPKIKMIMAKVKREGDRALMGKYKKRFGRENYLSLLVTQEEIKQAYKKVDRNLINSLKQMIKNITVVHKAQLPRKIDA